MIRALDNIYSGLTSLAAQAASRSIENPSVPLSEAYDYLTAGGMHATDTGLTINRDKALTYAAFWRGVSRISRDVAKIPLHVLKSLPAGGREKDRNHPAYRLLTRKANRWCKAFDFKQTLTGHAIMHGNGYAWIKRDEAAQPTELIILDPDSTYPVREDGVLYYATFVNEEAANATEAGAPNLMPVRLKADDVLHIRGFGFDGLCGYDVITYAKETLGLGLAARQHGAIHFKKGATPTVVLEHPGRMEPEHRTAMQKSWEKAYMGLNSSSVALLWHGMKANVIGADAKKSQFMELRQFEVREIALIIGMPPHKLGDDSRASYNSLEQEDKDYLHDALDGWVCQWEAETSVKLLTERQQRRDTHVIEAERKAIIAVDAATETDILMTELNNGSLSLNDVMRIKNRPGIGPAGDRRRRPANIAEIDLTDNEGRESSEAASQEAELDFKREIVKQYIADGTIGDVIFNLTDGRKLLEEVNLPVFGSEEEPWLPVVAADGRLVSGDTIEDDGGDIVGGDVVDDGEASQTGTEGLRDEGTEGEEGIEEEGDDEVVVDLEDDEDVRAAYGRVLKRSVAQRAEGHQTLLRRALWRETRRVTSAMNRAAGNADRFADAVAQIVDQHRDRLAEELADVLGVMGVRDTDKQAQCLAERYLVGLRHVLSTCVEPDDDARKQAVQRVAESVERDGPGTFVTFVSGDR